MQTHSKLGTINAVSKEQAKGDIEEIKQKAEVRMQLEEKLEEESKKEEKGHRSDYYGTILKFAASAFTDDWEVHWDMQKCREDFVKTGQIKEGNTTRGRETNKKGVNGSGRRSKEVAGEVMGTGYTGEKTWFRETVKGYEVDLTIDSGA